MMNHPSLHLKKQPTHLQHRVPQVVADDVRLRDPEAPPERLLNVGLRMHREERGQGLLLVRVPIAPEIP